MQMLKSFLTRSMSLLLALLVVGIPDLSFSQTEPIVSEDALRGLLLERAQRREENISELAALLEHHQVQKELGDLVDLTRIEQFFPTLDDDTLQTLAASSRAMDDSLEGEGVGTLLLIVVIAAVVAVVYFVQESKRKGS